jgi:hypothetical protein
MLEDWSDRLSATELRKASSEQEARIAAAIAEGRSRHTGSADRMLRRT